MISRELISKPCAVSHPDFTFLATADDIAEAGLLALRERRMRVTKVVSQPSAYKRAPTTDKQDFTSAKEKVLYRKDENTPAGLYL